MDYLKVDALAVPTAGLALRRGVEFEYHGSYRCAEDLFVFRSGEYLVVDVLYSEADRPALARFMAKGEAFFLLSEHPSAHLDGLAALAAGPVESWGKDGSR